MALNSLYCANVPLSNYSLTHWNYKTCEAPVKSSTTTNTQLFTGGMHFLLPNNSIRALKESLKWLVTDLKKKSTQTE